MFNDNEMTTEAVIDPLQLVPHRIKVFKLIYGSGSNGGATEADEHATGDVAEHRDGLTNRYSDDFNRAKRITSAELL